MLNQIKKVATLEKKAELKADSNLICFSNHRFDYYPVLENTLFDAVKLPKNSEIDMYKYSGYGISFDRLEIFSFHAGRFVCYVIIVIVDMSSSVHVHNKSKDNLILSEGPTQGLDGTKSTAEKNIQSTLLSLEKKCI